MILDQLKDKRILLASKSPRRQELLKGLGLDFEIVRITCDESYPDYLQRDEITQYISKIKAEAYSDLKADELLITADTLVCLEDDVLGKPKTEKAAFEMIRSLAGKTHQVYTSVCLKTTEKTILFSECTDVTFDEFTDEEINYYIENYNPMDKAGAYGIQDWLGFAKITGIKGCYYNVMGLPLQKLYRALEKI